MTTTFKLAVLAITLALSGCASNPDSTSALQADAIQSETTSQIALTKNAIDQASKTLAAAEENELSWFADERVTDAKTALIEAKEYYAEFELDPSEANSSSGFLSSKSNLEAANENITIFNANIEKAEAIKAQSLSILAEAFDYRQQLKNLEAASYFPNTSKQLDDELKELVDYVANEEIESAINDQPALVTKQRTLEVKVVTRIYLAKAEEELARLKKERISNFAPQTFSQAAASLTAAKAFIAAEPRAIDKIIEKANAVTFAQQHAEQVALEVKKLQATSQKVYERYILNIEGILLDISTTLGAADGRDKALHEQGKSIVSFIEDTLKNKQISAQNQQQLQTKLSIQESRLKEQANDLAALKQEVLVLTKHLQTANTDKTQLEQDLQTAKAKQMQLEQSLQSIKQSNNNAKPAEAIAAQEDSETSSNDTVAVDATETLQDDTVSIPSQP